jgi:uncharacterized phage protein gp47/JayE
MGQLTPEGFVIQRLDEIITRMDTGMRTIYGADIDTDPDSPDGQMIGLFSQALADLEELAGEMWRQMDPDYATGPNLDRIVAFSGTRRFQSNVSWLRSVILSGAARTPIPADSTVTDPSKVAWRSVQRVTLDANGSARVDFQSVEPGAYSVGRNEVLTIQSGVTGWRTAVTSQAATPGANQERDPDLRARFYLSRERTADDDAASMRGNLLALTGVDDAQVYENYTKVVDANGVQPNSINAVVDGGDEFAIGRIILALKPAGTGMQGETSVYVIDEFSRSREIFYDRPGKVAIYLEMTVTRRANFTDIDEDSIKRVLSETLFHIGEPVIRTELYGVMYEVPGFIVTALSIGISPTALSQNDIEIGPRDKAVIDVANIVINVVQTRNQAAPPVQPAEPTAEGE